MYIVVGGNPFRGHNGTLTYTSLSVVARYQTVQEVRENWKGLYEDHGGLLLTLDGSTGEVVDLNKL